MIGVIGKIPFITIGNTLIMACFTKADKMCKAKMKTSKIERIGIVKRQNKLLFCSNTSIADNWEFIYHALLIGI